MIRNWIYSQIKLIFHWLKNQAFSNKSKFFWGFMDSRKFSIISKFDFQKRGKLLEIYSIIRLYCFWSEWILTLTDGTESIDIDCSVSFCRACNQCKIIWMLISLFGNHDMSTVCMWKIKLQLSLSHSLTCEISAICSRHTSDSIFNRQVIYGPPYMYVINNFNSSETN